eukprot:14975005-Alexandrium_andersonii.AAC.1
MSRLQTGSATTNCPARVLGNGASDTTRRRRATVAAGSDKRRPPLAGRRDERDSLRQRRQGRWQASRA